MNVSSNSAEHYLDHNASTPIRPEALAAMAEVYENTIANPAALHRPGRRAQGFLEKARDTVADIFCCQAKQVVFTSSATEANNLAILGAAHSFRRLHGDWPQLITSSVEHPAVLGPMRALQQQGCELRLLPVNHHGQVNSAAFSALDLNLPSLVSIQWANNELGTVQPIQELLSHCGDLCHFHCDAVQGFGKLPLPSFINEVDSLSLSAHKFGGPIGIGALILGDNAFLDPCLYGGGQQQSLRPGTESPALAIALAVALQIAINEEPSEAEQMKKSATTFLNEVKSLVPDVVCNHPNSNSLPNTLSLSFPNIDGRLLLPALDAAGIAASTGSACSSGSPQTSLVLKACGVEDKLARATLRFSFARHTNESIARDQGKVVASVISRVYKTAIQ